MTIEGLISDSKLITCILPKGAGRLLQQRLIEDKGIDAANLHHARGVGRFSTIRHTRSIGDEQEKDILQLVAPSGEVDELFEYLFFEGEMNKPHGGIIYVTGLPVATPWALPDLPREAR